MKKLLTTILLLTSYVMAFTQPLSLDMAKSNMQILGTSSLHDWESKVEEFQVTAELSKNQISKISFSAVVKSIKSGKSGMDNNTYKALKEKEYPNITFDTDRLEIDGSELRGTGKLTIAGKSKDIPVKLALENTTSVSISGNIKLKMTDYDITPPTAVFGTIKTGDEITIQFNITLIKN